MTTNEELSPERIMTSVGLIDRPARYRVRVTVREWHARPDSLVDEMAYYYSAAADRCGTDPWRVVDGVDATSRGTFDVWFANGGVMECDGSEFLYIPERHVETLRRWLADCVQADAQIAAQRK